MPNNDAQHSALPWRLDNGRVLDPVNDKVIVNGFAMPLGMHPKDREATANAELIVRAANSHSQLVEALKNLLALSRPHFSDSVQMLALNEAEAALRAAGERV